MVNVGGPERALLAAAAALGAGGLESSSAEPPENTLSKSRMKSDTTGAPDVRHVRVSHGVTRRETDVHPGGGHAL